MRFSLSPKTGYLVIRAYPPAATSLAVNGVPLNMEPYTLHENTARVRIGELEYLFRYTTFAQSKQFLEARNLFVSLQHPDSSKGLALTPTPAPTTRSIGEWTLQKELGKGASGAVYSATSPRDEVVAIKLIVRNQRSAASVKNEVQTLTAITEAAKAAACSHIVALRGSIYPNGLEE